MEENEFKKIRKKRLKIKWKNIIVFISFLICFSLFLYSAYNIVLWVKDSINTKSIIKTINKAVVPTEIKDSDNTEIVGNNDVDKSNPYWDYIKLNLISVDFNELQAVNTDVTGWIQVAGTNINYPFVQTVDNDYYLTHSFDKKYNSAGWVFLDYRNNKNAYDRNTIIYAHGRYDKTMFGSLKNILTSNWYNDSKNYIVKISTEYENTLWQVFSVYRIPTTNDYLQILFSSNEEFQEFGNKLIARSAFNFNTTISSEDKIISLSTCYDDNDKVVMHAKLIKRETRQ